MIKVDNLRKTFGRTVAVDGVSLTVQPGEVLGFLGPNGAGKSTTMRMITGFLQPDAGSVRILTHDMEENPLDAKSQIGYLPENAPAYGDMKVGHFLRFIASMRGLSGAAVGDAVTGVVKTCQLEPVYRQSIATLSKGYTHRVCFAQALVHDPPVLVLDEPTDGLDPNQKHEVRELIRQMGKDKAIILSTHILEEVEAVCSRVVIIDRGKVVANASPDELRASSSSAGAVRVTILGRSFADVRERLGKVDGVAKVLNLGDGKPVDGPGEAENKADEDTASGAAELAARFGRQTFESKFELQESSARVLVVPKADGVSTALAAELGRACHEAGWALAELYTQPGRLDDVFREITTSEGGEQ